MSRGGIQGLVTAVALAVPAAGATIQDAAAPSVITGSNGLGMFAYHDRVNADLMVARCLDAVCSAVTTSVVDSAGDVGRHASMTPGGPSSLGPVIVYEDTTNGRLKIALCVDPACAAANTVVVASDIGVGHGSGVVIGIDGRPLVAYLRRNPNTEAQGSLAAAHCDNDGCTAVTDTLLAGLVQENAGVGIALGGDGLGVIASTRNSVLGGTSVGVVHCANQACTSLSATAAPETPPAGSHFTVQRFPSMAVGPDGVPTVAGAHHTFIGGPPNPQAFVKRCNPPNCAAGTGTLVDDAAYEPLAVAVGSDNLARLAFPQAAAPGLDFVRCLDAACTTRERTCLSGQGRLPSLTVDASGQSLVAHEIGDAVAVSVPSGSCSPVLTIGDASRTEGDAGASPLGLTVRLAPAQPGSVTVQYATADGTAVAGADYASTSGTVTFPPGSTEQTVEVQVLADLLDEAHETFRVELSSPGGATVAVGTGTGTILDDDTVPVVDIGDCAVVEGNAGTKGCVLEASLSKPYPEPVTVAYATTDGTATAGADYVAQSGVLTFTPGSVSLPVSIAVIGDLAVEPDELFTVLLSNPANATLGDATGDATIVDDDASPSADVELSHGVTVTTDLAAAPGPAADRDDYRLLLAPYASYEVVLDAVSGDAAPDVRLERIGSDGSTVLQTGTPVGTGSAAALRFQNRLGIELVGQSIRVGSAACGTACGSDDTYRLRTYETTGSIPRFNNSSTQVTVLLLQNRTADAIQAGIDFWDAAGVRRATHAVTVPAHGLLVLNTATLAAVAGTSGSITVTHDGGYAALAGKAVALEPATGFSFDSPLSPRPR